MEHITSERDGRLAIITLARGKANALNEAMVGEIHLAVKDASSDPTVRAVVLASRSPRFFSGGFDVAEVFAYDRRRMTKFFGRFIDLYEDLYLMPKPVIAAISGHAYAGGAVLAVACDFRVMAALNEIDLGFMLPSGIVRMAIEAVGYRQAFELVLAGRSLSPEKALQIGLASELAKPEALLERPLALARSLGEKPPSAFLAMKGSLRAAATGDSAVHTDRELLSDFIDQWFSPEAEERKRALIQSLAR